VARRRADQLLGRFGLSDAAGKPAGQYSGGMRRRLDLAVGLVLAPRVLFLDEPTSGLDPRGRNEVWEAVRALVAGGTTVLLTTQYLDEADQLAGQISVIDHGRVIADGSPEQLKSRIGGDRIDVVVRDAGELAAAAAAVGRAAGAEAEVDRDTRRVSAPVRDRVAALTEVVRALDDAGVAAEDIALRRPTLDEVFLRLTGRHTDEEAAAA
jgi:ABC-2 type transport system ATP-binding protein